MNKENIVLEKKHYMSLIFILTVLVITGNIISTKKIQLFGMVLSAYRIVLPCMMIVFLSSRIYHQQLKGIFKNQVLTIYLVMMLFWIIWGIGLLFYSPYVETREALKDLLSLLLGMISIYCFWELCTTDVILETVFKWIRKICVILCIWAIIEILTGVYLPYSKYCWQELVNKEDYWAVILQGLKDKALYPTTTIFHNSNDFSAFLAIFLPLFYVNSKYSKKENRKRGLILVVIGFVICVNDSNIAIIGTILSSIIYFLFENKKYSGKVLGILLTIYIVGNKVLFSLLTTVKSAVPIKVPESAKQYGSIMELIRRGQLFNMAEVLETQVSNAIGGNANSLLCRWQITLSSLRMTLKSKFLGVGPSGFSNYIEKYEESSKLVDPHDWWLEILSQYGIIVFLFYSFAMGLIFFKVCRLYKTTKNNMVLIYICMCLTFCLACIAPSNYLNYTYQWILPAIGIVLISFYNEDFILNKQFDKLV